MARKQNPINDIINTVGGWLGGRGPGTNPQVQAAMNATRAVGKVVDTATGGFGQALLSDAQRMAQTGSSTPSALYKTAAVNLGAAAAGVGAAKVAGKVVQSGLVVNPVAAARNAVKGERVVVSGTAFPIKGKTLQPTSGSNYSAAVKNNEALVFGFNPRNPGASRNVPGGAEYYAGRGFNEATGLPIQNPQYNVVVGTTPKKAVTKVSGGQGVVTSSAPVKISGVVKAPSPQGSVTYDQYVKALQKEIRKAGSSLRGEQNRLAKRMKEIRESKKIRNAPGVS